jgi:hypothetical protein
MWPNSSISVSKLFEQSVGCEGKPVVIQFTSQKGAMGYYQSIVVNELCLEGQLPGNTVQWQ